MKRLAIAMGILATVVTAGAQNVTFLSSTAWTEAKDVRVSGQYAYVTFYSGLGVFDVNDLNNPVLIATLGFENNALNMDLVGSYLYIANEQAGMRIINISNPHLPVVVSTRPLGTRKSVVDVSVSGNFAFLVVSDSTMHVIDITNPTVPRDTAFIRLPCEAWGIKVVGSYAYVADGDSMQIINIFNPAAPYRVGAYGYPGMWAVGITTQANYAYLSDTYNGLTIVNINNPTNPSFVGRYTNENGSFINRTRVTTNYAYCTDDANGLEIISISNPGSPFRIGGHDTPGTARSLWLMPNYCFVADGEAGFEIYNINDPTLPIPAGDFKTSYVKKCDAAGDYVYLATWETGMQIIDMHDPEVPVWIGSLDTPGQAQDIKVVANYAFIAARQSGVISANIADPAHPTQADIYDSPGYASALAVFGTYCYVADYNSVQILNIGNPSNIGFVGSLTPEGNPMDVFVDNTKLYVAAMSGGCQIYDLTDPASPSLLGTYDSPGNVSVVEADGMYAYLADDVDDVVIINVLDPSAPFFVSNYNFGDQVMDLHYSSNFVHVAYNSGGYYVLNVINKSHPTRSATYDTPGRSVGVFVYNEISYVADYYSLIALYFQDFSPGDANGDGQVNGLDVVFLVSYLKGIGPAPDPLLRGDANGDCVVNGLDVVYLIAYLKGLGPAPVRGNCR
jgi:hypothetical protein